MSKPSDDYEYSDDSDADEDTLRATSSTLANKHGFGGLVTKREFEFDLEALGKMNLKDSYVSEFFINKGVVEASGFQHPYFVEDLPVSVELINGKQKGGRRRKPTTLELINSIKSTKNMTLKDIGIRRQAMLDKMREYGDAGDNVVEFIEAKERMMDKLPEAKQKEAKVKFCRFLEYAQLYFSHYIYENIIVEGGNALVKRNQKEVAEKKQFLRDQMKQMKALENVELPVEERHFSPKKRTLPASVVSSGSDGEKSPPRKKKGVTQRKVVSEKNGKKNQPPAVPINPSLRTVLTTILNNASNPTDGDGASESKVTDADAPQYQDGQDGANDGGGDANDGGEVNLGDTFMNDDDDL